MPRTIVDLERAFLDTNGAHQETSVQIEMPSRENRYFEKTYVDENEVGAKWLQTLAGLNCCSQKGLVEMFDSSIGAGSVLMPYGGKYQLTETQTMVAKLPVLKGKHLLFQEASGDISYSDDAQADLIRSCPAGAPTTEPSTRFWNPLPGLWPRAEITGRSALLSRNISAG